MHLAAAPRRVVLAGAVALAAMVVVDAPRPRLRGRLHQLAFFATFPAGLAMVLVAATTAAVVAASIYWASLSGLYGTSAAYHRLARTPRSRLWMRRLDHSMIFVLIAGTSTPVSLLVLDGPWRVVGLATMWGGAAIGVALKMARWTTHSRFGSILYIILGWLTVLAIPQLVGGLSATALALLVAGGLLYTVGALVLLSRRPDPAPATFGYHEVWHSFVVGAGACHYVMILLVVQAAV